MASDPLRSPKSKVKRAKRHLADLERLVHDWSSRKDSYKLVVELDTKRGKELHKLCRNAEISDEIDVTIGDILGNLNAALDQATCAVAAAHGAASTKNVYFIVGDGPDVFESRRFETTIKRLPKAAVRLMRRLKPYKGGNDLLYGLHLLGSSDRHRILTPIGMISTPSEFYLPKAEGAGAIYFGGPAWHSLDDGIILFEADVGVKGEMHIKFTINIGFGETEVFKGEPVVAVVNQAINLVERIIGIFERRFFH